MNDATDHSHASCCEPGDSRAPYMVTLRSVKFVIGTRGCVGHVVLGSGYRKEQPVLVPFPGWCCCWVEM